MRNKLEMKKHFKLFFTADIHSTSIQRRVTTPLPYNTQPVDGVQQQDYISHELDVDTTAPNCH